MCVCVCSSDICHFVLEYTSHTCGQCQAKQCDILPHVELLCQMPNMLSTHHQRHCNFTCLCIWLWTNGSILGIIQHIVQTVGGVRV